MSDHLKNQIESDVSSTGADKKGRRGEDDIFSRTRNESNASRPTEFSACEAVSDGLMKVPSYRLPTSRRLRTHANMAVETGLRLIKLCCSIGCQAHITLVLDRILLPKADCDVRNQIEKGLIPVLFQLRKTVLPQSQIYSDEPYVSFAAKAIKVYIKAVLGQKPVETVSITQIGTVGCNQCEDCRCMRQFFLGEGWEGKVLSITKVQIVRAHLEKELAKTLAWGVTWTTNRSGSPHTLEITRPDTLIATTVVGKKAGSRIGARAEPRDEATLAEEFWRRVLDGRERSGYTNDRAAGCWTRNGASTRTDSSIECPRVVCWTIASP